MKPLVSVIIPNYNHARFLEERIQSVLNQTFQDFELIILDDCSPDDGASKAIIEQYRNNPHVSHIVYNEVNSGSTFKQWLKGMELARGEYIWIAESDDSCDKRLLEKLVDVITNHNAVMAFSKSVAYNVDGVMSRYNFQKVLCGDFVLDGSRFIREYLTTSNYIANASSVVFRLNIALNLDRFYMQMKGEGDWLFWILLAEQGKVCFVDLPLNYFRFHVANSTKRNTYNGTNVMDHMYVSNYLVKNGYLKGIKKYSNRVATLYLISNLVLDKEVKTEVMNLWDQYHVYRRLFPLIWLKKKIDAVIKWKTIHS